MVMTVAEVESEVRGWANTVNGRDLDEDGAGKDESGNQRIKRADRNGQSASGDHGNKRGTQGARAGGKDPRVHLQ